MRPIDWIVVGGYVFCLVLIGSLQKKRAEGKVDDYFVSGRKLPWWIAGTSMIAASFASDTPLLVSGLVRSEGIAGNWRWWGLGISLILSVFFFSRLWRRSLVLTEVEITEVRYSGRAAAGLRGFKAVYWGILFNCFVAGAWSVTGLAKVTQATVGIAAWQAVVVCGVIACIYSVLSGFWGVVATDCFQFVLAIFGAVICSYYAVQHAGGWDAMMANTQVQASIRYVPAADTPLYTVFLAMLMVQWWAFKNTDGGGLLVQRMAACRNERHAVYATLWYGVFHYSIRCWPWVVVALASIVLFPKLADNEMAYPMVINTVLPAGLKGLIIGWFLAEFMSSINTHTNWGSSMLVNDWYRRFVRTKETESHYIGVGRIATVVVMVGAVATALVSTNIAKSFDYVLKGTAAVGVVFVLRWLWWRANAWTEFVTMVLSPFHTFFTWKYLMEPHVLPAMGLPANDIVKLLSIVILSVGPALVVTMFTAPVPDSTLREFYRRVRPPGPGWSRIAAMCPGVESDLRLLKMIVLWLTGVGLIFSLMYSIYALLFGRPYGILVGAGSLGLLAIILWATRTIEDVGELRQNIPTALS